MDGSWLKKAWNVHGSWNDFQVTFSKVSLLLIPATFLAFCFTGLLDINWSTPSGSSNSSSSCSLCSLLLLGEVASAMVRYRMSNSKFATCPQNFHQLQTSRKAPKVCIALFIIKFLVRIIQLILTFPPVLISKFLHTGFIQNQLRIIIIHTYHVQQIFLGNFTKTIEWPYILKPSHLWLFKATPLIFLPGKKASSCSVHRKAYPWLYFS